MSDRPCTHDADDHLQRVWSYLKRRVFVGGFFGSVTIRIQNGKLCDVKLDMTKKLKDLDSLEI